MFLISDLQKIYSLIMSDLLYIKHLRLTIEMIKDVFTDVVYYFDWFSYDIIIINSKISMFKRNIV